MSCAEQATVADPSGRHLHPRVAVLAQGDARGAAGHAVIGVGRRRAAHADQPLALADRTRGRAPLAPPEPLGARAPSCHDVAGGEGRALGRVLLGLVADAQLDRVHAELGGQLVHRAFQAERADGFSWCAHEGVGEHVHVGHVHAELEGIGGVGATRRHDERFGHRIVPGHRHRAGVDDGGEAAVRLGPDRHPLLRDGPAADHAVNPFARQGHAHRAPGELGRRRPEHLMLPQRFGPEPSADIG